jgi:hypothetical protein
LTRYDDEEKGEERRRTMRGKKKTRHFFFPSREIPHNCEKQNKCWKEGYNILSPFKFFFLQL